MPDTDQKKEDEVLRRMLATKPSPHKSQKPTEKNPAGLVKNNRSD